MLLKFDNFEIKLNLDNSETALKLAKLRSFKAQISTWGEEIYFETTNLGIKPDKNARDIVIFGEVAYWCGRSFNSNWLWKNASFYRKRNKTSLKSQCFRYF